MNEYELLLDEAYKDNITVKEVNLHSNAKGLYINNKVAINKRLLETEAEKRCVLAEELAHHYSTVGNIIDLNDNYNSKQEYKARSIAFEKLIDLNEVAYLVMEKHLNKYELIEELNVTEEFFSSALKYFENKYGTYKHLDKYTLIFKPHLAFVKKL